MEKRQSLAGLEKANCHAGESTIWQGPALRWVHSIAVKKTDQSYNCKEINSVKTMRELGRLTLPRWGHIASQHIDLGFRSWLTETVRKQSATFVAGNLLNSNRQGKQIWHKQRISGHIGKALAQPTARGDFLKEDPMLRPGDSASVRQTRGGEWGKEGKRDIPGSVCVHVYKRERNTDHKIFIFVSSSFLINFKPYT